MMSNNLATNLHLMVSIWKFETKLLTWETFQREMNPIGQLLWKNLKPHISKLLNLLSFCLFFSNVALHCCKHFEIVSYCWYVWLSIHQFIQISKFVWSNFSWCLSPWLVLYSPLFQPLVCYIFTDYLSNWLNVPGWSRMNCCKKKNWIDPMFVQYSFTISAWFSQELYFWSGPIWTGVKALNWPKFDIIFSLGLQHLVEF